jgi:CRISPR system Cascade subunit CasD
MSINGRFLALRLEGPLQSWGFDSQYNRRNTGLMPTKSAIGGICCAALGYNRGGSEESRFLEEFRGLRMISIAIPRIVDKKFKDQIKKEVLKVRRLQDYHTVLNTVTADGNAKPCHITHRGYLSDAMFGVILEGKPEVLEKIAAGLADPVWGIWLGRKSCIPTAPVLAGMATSKEDALRLLKIDALEKYTFQEDAETFAEGRDSLPDIPVSFASDNRRFSPRRVRMAYAE